MRVKSLGCVFKYKFLFFVFLDVDSSCVRVDLVFDIRIGGKSYIKGIYLVFWCFMVCYNFWI